MRNLREGGVRALSRTSPSTASQFLHPFHTRPSRARSQPARAVTETAELAASLAGRRDPTVTRGFPGLVQGLAPMVQTLVRGNTSTTTFLHEETSKMKTTK